MPRRRRLTITDVTSTDRCPQPNLRKKPLGIPAWLPVTKALVLSLAVPRPLHAATYIVDDDYDGSNANTACEQAGGASYFTDPLPAVTAAAGALPGSGHNIRLCPGTYTPGSTLALDQPNHTNLVFEGTSGVATDVLIVGGAGKGKGKGKGKGTDIIQGGVSGLTLRHVSTQDGDGGVVTDKNATSMTLDNLVISTPGDTGVDIQGSSSVLSNISIVNANDEGIEIDASNVVLNGANISSSKDGLRLEGGNLSISNIVVTSAKACISGKSAGGQLSNLTLSGCSKEGLNIDGKNASASLSVKAASITNPGSDGVRVKNLTNTLTLSNLQITNAGRDGIRVENSSNVSVYSSSISGSNEQGIGLRDSNSGTFAGNTVALSGGRGLFVEAKGLSNNHLIFGNCFSNAQNVVDDETTALNTYNIASGGNFYGSNSTGTGFSETCTDANGDNICDAPYTIPGAGPWVDNLPLRTCVPTTSDVRLTFAKSVEVVTDPVGSPFPKAIPGAEIRYTVTVEHVGTLGDASDVTLNEDLDGNITTLGQLSWAPGSMELTAPDVGGGAPTGLTDASDADEGEFSDVPGSRTIAVDCGGLSPGESCTLTYEVLIQ